MSRNQFHRSTTGQAFIASLVFLLFAGTSTTVFAKWERHAATACKVSHYARDGSDMRRIHDTGNVTNYSTLSIRLICDIEDTDRFSKQEITTLNIHVRDNSSTASIYAKACYTMYNGTGGSCGSTVSSGGAFTGEKVLRVPLTAWTNSTSAQMGYVIVELPADVAPAGGDTSSFHGYYISDY